MSRRCTIFMPHFKPLQCIEDHRNFVIYLFCFLESRQIQDTINDLTGSSNVLDVTSMLDCSFWWLLNPYLFGSGSEHSWGRGRSLYPPRAVLQVVLHWSRKCRFRDWRSCNNRLCEPTITLYWTEFYIDVIEIVEMFWYTYGGAVVERSKAWVHESRDSAGSNPGMDLKLLYLMFTYYCNYSFLTLFK